MNEFRPGGFQILPPIIKNLIIINVLVFAATFVLQKANIVNLDFYLALFHWDSPLFKFWQPITHIFMHADLTHLFFNMFALWMFGSVIENTMGPKKFLIFYFVCGFGAALCHLLVFNFENLTSISYFNTLSEEDKMRTIVYALQTGTSTVMTTPMLGASGAVMGVLFAFGYLFPNSMIYIYFLFPIKAKYLVAIYAAIELFAGFRNSPTDNVAHFAHLGGMLFAYLLLRYWKTKNRTRNQWY